MLSAHSIQQIDSDPADTVTLGYDDRFRRRMVMVGDNGLKFLLDLPKSSELRAGDDLLLEDGRHVRVIAADEELMRATCANHKHLTRTAWHIGNRHLPCEIHAEYIVLRRDKVIAQMLAGLGCNVENVIAPFNPEGGAYGEGRTHSHEH